MEPSPTPMRSSPKLDKWRTSFLTGLNAHRMCPLGGVSTAQSTLLSVLIGLQSVWWFGILMFSLPPPQLCDQASSLSVHSPKNRANRFAGLASGAGVTDVWPSSGVERAQSNKGTNLENVIRRDLPNEDH